MTRKLFFERTGRKVMTAVETKKVLQAPIFNFSKQLKLIKMFLYCMNSTSTVQLRSGTKCDGRKSLFSAVFSPVLYEKKDKDGRWI